MSVESAVPTVAAQVCCLKRLCLESSISACVGVSVLVSVMKSLTLPLVRVVGHIAHKQRHTHSCTRTNSINYY